MKLRNETKLSAALLRTVIDEERLMASVVVRVTYRIVGQGLVPHDEQPWAVSEKPQETPYGELEPERPFRRGGVDLFLFGTAWAPGRRPTKAMELRIDVGTHDRRVLVIGDRFWRKGLGELVASDPLPFSSMPLGHDRAYGGQAKWDGAIVPFGDNPEGRGYYVEAKDAVDQPLPSLELLQARVGTWSDQPEPACLGLCVPHNGLRLRNSMTVDDQGRMKELLPTAFNSAFPRMILPPVEPGTPVQLQGIDPRGPLAFALPDPGVVVELRFGSELVRRMPFIDQIGLEPDLGRVFVTWRYPFRYVMIPKQERHCALLPAPAR
jgi:hypothetical protein